MIQYKKISSIEDYNFLLDIFFGKVRYGRYLSDIKLDVDKSIQYEIKKLQAYAKSGNLYFAIENNNKLIGMIGFQLSKWDTDIFEKRIAKIDYFLVDEKTLYANISIAEKLLSIFHSWVRENEIDVAIVRLDTNFFTPIIAVQKENYIFFECITIPVLDLISKPILKPANTTFRYFKKGKEEELKNFAVRNGYKKSHFYLDPKFNRDKVDRMYATWIGTALEKNQKMVIIEDGSNNVIGIFLYDVLDLTDVFNKKFGMWKYAAVDNKYRGKGYGKKLFYCAIKSCKENNVDIIDSGLATKNTPSVNLHTIFGFRNVCSLYTFHKWFD